MSKKPKRCRVYSYAPDKCMILYVSIPLLEMADAKKDGKAAIEEMASHYGDMMADLVRKTAREGT
mgnify:FL=1